MPQIFNEAYSDLPPETIQAGETLDCRLVFEDGQCFTSCSNCGLLRKLAELHFSDLEK
jgi:hypothetical protein